MLTIGKVNKNINLVEALFETLFTASLYLCQSAFP